MTPSSGKVLVGTLCKPARTAERLERDILPAPVIATVALIAASAFLLKPTGFIPTSFPFLAAAIRLLSGWGMGRVPVTSALSVIGVRVVFRLVISVPEPPGIVPEAQIVAFFRNLLAGARAMDALNALRMPRLDLRLLSLGDIGTFAGICMGGIPGLPVTMAVSILICCTFARDVLPALSPKIGICMGGGPWRDAHRASADHSRRALGDRQRARRLSHGAGRRAGPSASPRSCRSSAALSASSGRRLPPRLCRTSPCASSRATSCRWPCRASCRSARCRARAWQRVGLPGPRAC